MFGSRLMYSIFYYMLLYLKLLDIPLLPLIITLFLLSTQDIFDSKVRYCGLCQSFFHVECGIYIKIYIISWTFFTFVNNVGICIQYFLLLCFELKFLKQTEFLKMIIFHTIDRFLFSAPQVLHTDQSPFFTQETIMKIKRRNFISSTKY